MEVAGIMLRFVLRPHWIFIRPETLQGIEKASKTNVAGLDWCAHHEER
jgi:hypothetical protein